MTGDGQFLSRGARSAGQQVGRVDALVEAAARRDPAALAVVAPDATLTYGTLLERADAVADRLRDAGLTDGTLVGLCLPRSAALVVGALAVLRAGAAYVALDPESPAERLHQLLADCGAPVVLTPPSGALVADPPSGATVLELTADGLSGDVSAVGAGRVPTGDSSASPLAYVVYTSGSTGTPKGVLVEHAGLLNLVEWHRRAFSLTPADRGTQIASPGFDASVWEIWSCLSVGASLHVPPLELRADPAALRDWLLAEEVTVSFLPTALAEQLFVQEWPAAAALRFVLTGGDRLRQLPPAGLPFTVVNNYGVSEGTVVSTSGTLPTGTDAGVPTIGRPIDGVETAVVGPALDLLPAGTVGELLIGGVSVARGYLNRPELTAERFVSPEWAPAGQRWYRTGDLVSQRPDGEIEFRGRIDDQVQVRGVRIEPGEVAASLDAHPDVATSVVTAVGEGLDLRLHAYVVAADPDRRPSRRDLQDHLGRSLPAAMVPSGFTWLLALPYNQNGKVDRAALPAPEPDAEPAPAGGPADTGTDLEALVGALVAELLGRSHVDVDDNFFLLGGHSLLGAQLIARIGDEFGVALGLRALFDHPTAAGLATEVERLILAETEDLTDEEAASLLAELDKPSTTRVGADA